MFNISDLRLIEVELFSYCNRKCPWCPNNYIDRRSETYTFELLDNLLEQLKAGNYNGHISFSRYNEPMSKIDYFKQCLVKIYEKLPDCTLVTNTNGDYINEDNLKGLLINELSIMDYDNRGMEWCKKRLLDCNVVIDKVTDKYIYGHYGKMKILYYVDWRKHHAITDRGGNLAMYSNQVRDYACYEPLYFIGVNYDGTVSPCCNIRNDASDMQRRYIIGDLNKDKLIDILNSKTRVHLISDCISCNFKEDSPCYYCMNKGGRYTKDGGGIDYE